MNLKMKHNGATDGPSSPQLPSGYTHIPRTRVARRLDLVNVMLLIVMWMVAILEWQQAPDLVPTHFTMDNEPNGFGPRSQLLVTAGIAMVVELFVWAVHRMPLSMVNMPFRLTNIRQYARTGEMLSALNIAVTLLVLGILFNMGQGIVLSAETASVWLYVSLGLMVAVIIVYLIVIYHTR